AAAFVAPFAESSVSRRAISAFSWPMRSVSSPADSRDRSSPIVCTLGFLTGSSSKIAIKFLRLHRLTDRIHRTEAPAQMRPRTGGMIYREVRTTSGQDDGDRDLRAGRTARAESGEA